MSLGREGEVAAAEPVHLSTVNELLSLPQYPLRSLVRSWPVGNRNGLGFLLFYTVPQEGINGSRH